jgi:amidophosphoribosyltransferase
MCGIVGVELIPEVSEASLAAHLTYDGLFALQHRGQHSAGIGVVNDNGELFIDKNLGLLTQVFREQHQLMALTGRRAVGQVRYSTTGAATWTNAQPHPGGLAHNGNLTNTWDLVEEFCLTVKNPDDLSDSWVVSEIIAICMKNKDQSQFVQVLLDEVLPRLKGAYCMIIADESRLIGIRDPHGFHPLCFGRRDDGWILASESKAIRDMGGEFVRELEPGEMLVIEDGVETSHYFAPPQPKLCLLEIVYFAGHSSMLYGRENNTMRVELGRRLAKVMPVQADMVIPVPFSSIPHAIGYSQASGIPYGEGLEASRYSDRTFLAGGDWVSKAKRKFHVLVEAVRGKIIIVVDDSIVRSSTQQVVVDMLLRAGATEVHVRVSMDRWVWPCFYGINASTSEELVAANMTVEETRKLIRATSLAYMSVEEMVKATGQEMEKFCTACMTGEYPVKVNVPVRLTTKS